MTDDRPQPRSFRADLAEGPGEATITLGDPPTLAFSRPPYGFTRPLAREELGALAAGRFVADLDAQLRACAPPPLPPLGDAGRARIVRLAGEAWIALTVGAGSTTEPDPPAMPPAPVQVPGQAGLWPTFAPTMPAPTVPVSTPAAIPPEESGPVATMPEMAGPDDAEIPIAAAVAASPDEVAHLPAPPAPRRALKVTLTLTPDGATAYRALVGVGADGCDPHFLAIEPPGALAAILGTLPEAVAAAEERWRAAPRYPGSGATAGASAPAKPATPAKAGAKKPARHDLAPAPAPAATDAPAAKRQIELFG